MSNRQVEGQIVLPGTEIPGQEVGSYGGVTWSRTPVQVQSNIRMELMGSARKGGAARSSHLMADECSF